MFGRLVQDKLRTIRETAPVVAVVGPRQSGKSTILKTTFPEFPHIDLDDQNTQAFARSDPKRFLESYPKGAILDEVQRVPELFPALKIAADQSQLPARFLLSGSQNFLLMQGVSESLAGRVRLLTLLPLCYDELPNRAGLTLDEVMWRGGYPRPWATPIPAADWLADYTRTYVERDVRNLQNVQDLRTFTRFLRLCAGRSGQLLNLQSLAVDCGISHPTARAWLGVLEASFVIHTLEPHHNNYSKRIKRSPKLYFNDTGLLCSLLQIRSAEELNFHPNRGAIFETFCMAELLKLSYAGTAANFSFWQDKTGREVDCIVDDSVAVAEFKSGATFQDEWLANLQYWLKLAGPSAKRYLVYGGELNQTRNGVEVLAWRGLRAVLGKAHSQPSNG